MRPHLSPRCVEKKEFNHKDHKEHEEIQNNSINNSLDQDENGI
jgi:hypothetical protein